MRQYGWILVVVGLTYLTCTESRTITKRETDLDPVLQDLDEDDAVRDKRSQQQDLKFGIKNAILGFVFNPSKAASQTSYKPRPTTPRPKTTTEDIVIFEKDKPVSLDFPDQLFGSSFTLVTNLSETVGDFMINSALRFQRLLESMRPFLRSVFGAKGIVIEATTDRPIFSDPNANNVR